MGGGFELALSCDLIYASAATQFGLPEINAGTLADAATIKLPKRMPYHVAMELLLTGRWMPPTEAARWGVVNEVLADEEAVLARAWETARLLASGPPLVFAAIKETARAAEALRFQEALDLVTAQHAPDGRRPCTPPRTAWRASGPSPRSGRRSGRAAEPALLRTLRRVAYRASFPNRHLTVLRGH